MEYATNLEGQKIVLAAVCPLVEAENHPDSQLVTRKFGHKRYKYDISQSTNDVKFDLVLRRELLRQAILVPDFHELGMRFSKTITVQGLPNNSEERSLMHFFCLLGHQITALPPADF